MTSSVATPLSPQTRAAAIEALAGGDELDILVVGGGVTGVGCALDAVTRGLRTGLVEQRARRNQRVTTTGFLHRLNLARRHVAEQFGRVNRRLNIDQVNLPIRATIHRRNEMLHGAIRGAGAVNGEQYFHGSVFIKRLMIKV